ncbi:HesB/IscA family protein [Thalassolituus hydrocarboniclasticus]|jgi:iron-sulfur cluster assembly accessory protein|uniref:Iron-sulfur cluster assembly accessory protein n=1 Tax=Thalassolituus hydrocarboniclasticus TaxID=2742796 RepID=A0ABY6AD00_9GAMM|nr:iron-sulfur cluster assembly accessory protein [Thalassolituus hydrocarboniclasticus]UXD88043.1 iron-sulfur cluster assembly accessory protein [Thalassolituus hydrocarboniclasticus]
MSTETFDPNAQPATYDPNAVASASMTEAAISHIRKQLAKNPAMKGIRLGVKKSGCSGFKYDIEFVEQAHDGDQTIQVADDILLFIAADAAPYVRGTEIDFSKEGLNSTIKFNNPNAKDLCGCGESFSV